MSLWKTISASPELQQRMIQYYNEKGLLDLRIHFAQWIEERITSEHFTKAPIEQYKQLASKFYEDLQQKLITAANDNSMKFKINSIGNYIAQTSALDIYTHIRQGVFQEVQMLEPMSQNPYFIPGIAPNMGPGAMMPSPHDHSGFARHPPEEFIHIHQSITLLLADLEPFRAKLFSLRNDYEDYRNRWNEFHAQATNAEMQMEMDHRKRNILANKNELDLNARDLFRRYDPIQNAVIDELKKWQRQQALAGNGASFTENNLDQIQRCIELLVDIICKLLMYIAELARILESAELTELIRNVRSAQRILYCSAFVVEKQPPQVMKTNTRFAAAVRWLIGGQLNINLNSPTVECVILSEAQAHRQFVQRNHDGLPSGTAPPHSGEIHNNTCVMEFNHQTRVFSASFRNMQLKKIKRAEKKGTESVMDEKFALLFYTSTIVDDCQLRVWTLSLPVVVIVHGNQEPQSWATITWDNAFAEIVREPFHVPDKVSWNQLALALSMKFASATGRGLTQENLVFLYEKLFRSDNVNSDHKEFISWAQFCKEPLPDRAFTFWEWFFAIMKLTKDHLLGIWKKDLVVGFISKYNTDVKLRSNPTPGSFLLRFSDSELGGISVAFINEDNNTVNLAPWVARDLHIRGLADRIQDLHMLRCVYPGYINRDDAFSEFYTQRTEASVRDGYVPSTIVAAVPSLSNENSFMQSPQRADIPMANDHFNIDLDRLLY